MTNSELTAVFDFEKIRFSNDGGDTVICLVIDPASETYTVKGVEPDGGFHKQRAYRFFGHWSDYKNRRTGLTEKQFSFSSSVECVPFNRHGVMRYLQRASGIGPKLAQQLWSEFGSDAVKNIREGINLDRVPDLRLALLESAAEFFNRDFALEGCTIELLDILDGTGVPKKTISRCLSEWGNRAALLVRRNPYLLMRFPGIGFLICDRMYLNGGGSQSAMRRQVLCGWHGIVKQQSLGGHTWVPESVPIAIMRGMIGDGTKTAKAIRIGVKAGLLAAKYTDDSGQPDMDGDTRWLAEGRMAKIESRLAASIVAAMKDIRPEENIRHPEEMSDHQEDVIGNLFVQPGCLHILGGGPGTGKTYVVVRIVKQLLQTMGPNEIAIAAPTGKASVTITEALSLEGIPIVARTWHSLLGVQGSSAGGGWSFNHGADNPLPFRCVIGDETSMLDTAMAANIFSARGRGTMYFFVGDANQLPPVGAGAPLRDMIAAGVPYGKLSEVRRNSGEIVKQCHRMQEHATIDIPLSLDLENGQNIMLIEASTEQSQIEALIGTVTQLAGGYDPVSECFVITPTNDSGILGRKHLNRVLQNRLNASPVVSGSPFRLYDKIVCSENQYMRCEAADDSVKRNKLDQVYVANGDIGISTECQEKDMEIEFRSPYRLVTTGRSSANELESGCSFELAYALSCHKFQGSETAVAIVMLDKSSAARMVCDRSWLYTAIPRAKVYCICIGELSTARRMVRFNKIDNRKTFLAELIKQELEEWNQDRHRLTTRLSS